MDVPFKSISVRDFLPSHNVDDSSPLSAPDLRLIIDHLQVRSLQIKSKVQNYIVSHHSDFSALFSQCSASFSGAEHLSGEVSDLIRLVSESPIDAEIKEVVDEVSEKRREVREKRKVLELVSVIVEVSEKLRFVREEMRDGRVFEAAERIRELEEALRIRGGEVKEEEAEPVVYGFLRSEWMECYQEIQDVLAKFMENAVSFDQQSNALRVKYWSSINGNSSVELHTVLKAMDVVGIMDFGLAKVADLIIKYVITQTVNPESHIFFSEEINQDSGRTTEVVLKMVPSFDPELKGIDGQAIFTGSIQVVKFIYDSFCFQNSHWMRCFGRLTWPRMSELIITNFLSKVVPDDPSKLADFQSIIQLTTQFETELKDLMFISATDNKDERLSEFADNVEVHFASRKKVEILAKARSLLLQSNFVLPSGFTRDANVLKNEQTDENSVCYADLLFSSERCVVSGGAVKLMALVHQTLKDVCLSSTRVGIEFYHAARDALLLYEAVIPAKLGRQLDSINQVAVLIYNDCLYLSREIHGLAFEYRPDLPSSLKELVVFVDLAPRFQLMAEDILHRQIQLVIHNLKEAVDGADGFQNTHQMKEFESAKFSIDQVVFILEKVHIIWEPLLLPLAYKRCMSMVLEAVFSRITKDILLLDDMAAEETLQLQRLIHLLLESLSSLLESLNAITDTRKMPEGSVQSIDELVPSLRKIRKLAGLMAPPMAQKIERGVSTEIESVMGPQNEKRFCLFNGGSIFLVISVSVKTTSEEFQNLSLPDDYVPTTKINPIALEVNEGSSLVSVGSMVYSIGGCKLDELKDVPTDEVIKFDTDQPKLKLESCCNMILPRVSPAVVGIDGKIYVFGGFSRLKQTLESPWAEYLDTNKPIYKQKWKALKEPVSRLSWPVSIYYESETILISSTCNLKEDDIIYNVANESSIAYDSKSA